MTRVVLAPDKFKGTLTAAEVAHHLATGIVRVRPDVAVTRVPVADGGDGLLDAAVAAGFTSVEVEADDASGTARPARYVRRGDRAVVELAEVCGLTRHGDAPLDPLGASSRGVGQVLGRALADGCRSVVLGVGGSASTDGGAGMVQALGARALDASGVRVPDGGAALATVVRLDLDGLDPRLRGAEIVIACDVDNPLTGEHGAAAVYGPQKGADPQQVLLLDEALGHWADVVADATGADRRDLPGAGAAGGVGFAAAAVLGAALSSGAEVVFALTGLADALVGADLVVTGEGSLDQQTLRGKAPVRVADLARSAGVPVAAVAGRCTLSAERLARAGLATTYSLTDLGGDHAAMHEPARLVEQVGERIAAGLPGMEES